MEKKKRNLTIKKVKKTGMIPVGRSDKMFVKVKVICKKTTYGKTSYLISPVSGSGEIWVRNVEDMN